MEEKKNNHNDQKLLANEKPGIVGFVALILFLVMFSGVLKNIPGWQALDFTCMLGNYGTVGETGANWLGTGGTGAREGFLSAFGNLPTIMLAMGLVALVTKYKGLLAAKVLFTPLLRPLLGIPGEAGLTFVTSLNSSDAGAAMTSDLATRGYLTENERTTFVAFQYAGSGAIVNTIAAAAMAPMMVVSPLGLLLVVIVMKFVAGNFVRILLASGYEGKKDKKARNK
jgi:nucleoside recognition membrane protein YjiH